MIFKAENFFVRQAFGSFLGLTLLAGLASNTSASPVTVTDVTDWGSTPMEIVNTDLPALGYPNGVWVYAGINTLSVTDGGNTTVYSGFCIDPFHWSATGPVAYNSVPLMDAPKAPATLNNFTALEIEDLWAQYFSPTMSASSAAGLQIAIWELVSSNAVASDGLPLSQAFSLNQGNDYGAASDIASLSTYEGAPAVLTGLTGSGQDYVIQEVNQNTISVPDHAETLLMLAFTFGAILVARPALLRSANPLRLAPTNPVLSKH